MPHLASLTTDVLQLELEQAPKVVMPGRVDRVAKALCKEI